MNSAQPISPSSRTSSSPRSLKALINFTFLLLALLCSCGSGGGGYTSLTIVPASPLALPVAVTGAAIVMAVLPFFPLLLPPPPTLDLLRLQQPVAGELNFSSSSLPPHPPPDQILKWRNRITEVATVSIGVTKISRIWPTYRWTAMLAV